VITNVSGNPAPGLLFATANAGTPGYQPGALIYDNSGQPVWFLPVGASAGDLHPITYLGQPALIYFQYSCPGCYWTGQWIVLNNHYQQVAQIAPGNGYIADTHSLLISPDGTKALLDAYNTIIYDLSPYGGPPDATVWEAVIQEIDLASGQVDFEWHSLSPGPDGQPFVPVTESELPLTGSPVDYIHLNSLAYDTDGNILFSGRSTSTIYKINKQTGAIMWRLGGKNNQFTFTDGDGGPSFGHDVQVIGPGTISMFDNGVTRSPPYSRGVVWALDTTQMTAHVVTQWRHSPDLFGLVVGSNRLLPGGDQLISWGNTGYTSEFSPSGTVVFSSQLQSGAWSYRTIRADGWHATPAAPPALAISRPDLTDVSVAASWNGATDVAQWQLWGGPSWNQLRQLASVSRSGFETMIPAKVMATDHIFQVRAIDANGLTLGISGNAADAVQQKYQSIGGASSFLGAPVGATYQVGAGLGQNYANGAIYWSAATGAWSLRGDILAHYQQLGGPAGVLGFPVTDETGTPDGVGRFNRFQYGSMYWTAATGAHEVHGWISVEWQALGWERSVLGYPTSDETGTPDGVGRFNHFQFGSIYWTPATGAHEVHGAIYAEWASLGSERSVLGYPTTDESIPPGGGGRYNHFQAGSIYWTPATGAHEVHGAIRAVWASLGWERSFLGYPLTDEFTPFPGYRQSNFQGGFIRWNAATGLVTVQ
jgi:uncharacterized protein with LGFP repeats